MKPKKAVNIVGALVVGGQCPLWTLKTCTQLNHWQCKYCCGAKQISVTFNPKCFKIMLMQTPSTLSVLPRSYVNRFKC